MTTALVGKTDLKELTVVSCDGTAVNTGRTGGVIRLLELLPAWSETLLAMAGVLTSCTRASTSTYIPVCWWRNDRTVWILRNTRQRVRQVQRVACHRIPTGRDWPATRWPSRPLYWSEISVRNIVRNMGGSGVKPLQKYEGPM